MDTRYQIRNLPVNSRRCLIGRFRMFLLLIAILQTGCQGAIMVGLHPEYPPVEIKTFSLYAEYVEVDTLQPTFRWQPLKIPRKEGAAVPAPADKKIENITYELRIWHITALKSGKQVYARDGLTDAYHRVEMPLQPDTRYLWSVRAHFRLNGRPRTIEWSLAGYALRNEAVPNESCLRFQTPAVPLKITAAATPTQ
jgi:hypothetical protein